MSNHGYIAACLGPVVDVQLASDIYLSERSAYRRVRQGLAEFETPGQKAFYIGRDMFYPTVYDSITVVRPCVCFREGITATNSMSNFHSFIDQIPYNDTYLLAVIHLIPGAYGTQLDVPVGMEWTSREHNDYGVMEESYSRSESVLAPSHRVDLVLGFTSLYLLVKSYWNSLVAEVSQQMYGGILRCISLGSTEGLSTWKCTIQLNMQAVIVPVGRISLGRILNVVGSAVDIYDDQPIALVFSQSPVYVGRIAALNTNQLVRTLAATMNEMEVGL
ncbi:MAG: hypothetical protein GY814_10760, partial [Gammaproteobacteria bacterium]|nr:hypothetical protein [Gammaproteobacteria bacterium]